MLWAVPKPRDRDDHDFAEYLGLVVNQQLQRIRKQGWSLATLEKVGKALFRVFPMLQAYKEKKRRYTAAGWLARAAAFHEELKDAFD